MFFDDFMIFDRKREREKKRGQPNIKKIPVNFAVCLCVEVPESVNSSELFFFFLNHQKTGCIYNLQANSS